MNSPYKGQWRGVFYVFFDLRRNKRLSKQPTRWWLERHRAHCDAPVMLQTSAEIMLRRKSCEWRCLDVEYLITSIYFMYIWHFSNYTFWTFVLGIHWSPVNSPRKDQWHRALMLSLICIKIGWANSLESVDMITQINDAVYFSQFIGILHSPALLNTEINWIKLPCQTITTPSYQYLMTPDFSIWPVVSFKHSLMLMM